MKRYSYKESGVEWLGKVPEHWEVDRIRDLSIINDKALSNSTNPDFKINYIDIGNVNSSGIVDFNQIEELSFEEAPSRARRKIEKNDTIISSVRTNLQAVAYIDFEMENLIGSTGFFVCRPRFSKILANKFLYYFLLTDYSKEFFFSHSIGVSYPAINEYKFSSINIPLPPLPEQKAIADYLDKACERIDRIIAIKEEQLRKIEGYLNSKMNEILSRGISQSTEFKESGFEWFKIIPSQWKVVRLKKVLSKINSGVTPKGGATSYLDDGIPLIRSQNVKNDSLDMSDVVFIDEETHESMKNSKVQNGDVLLNITGASLGRCQFVENIEEANVNQHVCILRPFQFIETKFLYYLLRSEIGQAQIFSGFKGSGREGLNFEAIKNFRIPLPNRSEQVSIIKTLDQLLEKKIRLSRKAKSQISSLQSYRKSLIHECVTGKKQVSEIAIGSITETAPSN